MYTHNWIFKSHKYHSASDKFSCDCPVAGLLSVYICYEIGYNIWRSYNPEISIFISDASSGGGADIKIKAPQISMAVEKGIEPVKSVNTRIDAIINQHEELCKYVVDHYKASNIQLKMEVRDDTTTLIYHGTAVTMNDEVVDFEKKIKLDFTLKAIIEYQ